MIKDPEEVLVGQLVFLYPHTKTASRACWQMKQVEITKPPKKHWPMLVVEWYEGKERRWELVHKDNIRINQPTGKAQGDATQDNKGSTFAEPRPIKGRVVKVELPPGMEQETLF